MADVPDIPRPSQLWKRLSPDAKLKAADAFWRDDNAAAEHAEAVATIAQRLKFRVKSVIGLPREKKARHLASMPMISELVAARLLVAYHLETQRPMMGAFLDALGVKHDAGLIEDEEMSAPAAEKLHDAARTLSASFPADDVALYFSTLMWQDPDTWGGLAETPESRLAS